MRHHLLSHGLTPISEDHQSDVVVLNTCTVTAAADAQAREAVRKIHRANPSTRIVVTGCYAQRAPEEIAGLPGVSLVVGNSHQSEIADAISIVFGQSNESSDSTGRDLVPLQGLQSGSMTLARGPAKILTGDIFAQETIALEPAQAMGGDRTRPILKIQDGCNNRCSYCVIPFVRGKSRSLPPDIVISEVGALVAAGAKEVVLSGINLGSYGRDLLPRVEFATLLSRLLREADIEQIRLSSIEPQDITEDFVTLAASSDRIAAHFHVPLQSGSNRILRAMHRWYRAEHYAERIRLIRALMPNAGIGADVIVGFPGETDRDFEETVALVEMLPFSYLHVFSFSPRPGTKAEKFTTEVPSAIVRERARALRALSTMKAAEFWTSQAGQSMRALTLHKRGSDWTEALTGNYLKIRIAGQLPANNWRHIRLPGYANEIAGTGA